MTNLFAQDLVLSKRFIEGGDVPIRHYECASKH